MDYQVNEISLDDPEVELQTENLIAGAFEIDMPAGRVLRNTTAPDRPAPLYVAAVEQSEIIGFNAFIGHRLRLNGEEVLAYQSCWTATSPRHRGKKIFQNLILFAHDILAARGAAFVFGFPNSESHPIFVGKLGYREIPSVKWQMPNLPFATSFSFVRGNVARLNQDAFGQDDRALIALKRNERARKVEEFQHRGSLCWGVRRRRRLAGVEISYADVGGVDLVDARHLPFLISGLKRKFPGVMYVQLVSIAGAPINQLFRSMKPSKSNVLIVHDLNRDTTEFRFNFFGGIRDVY